MRAHVPALMLIALVAGGVFANALHGAFVWDDQYIILENDGIRDVRRALASFAPAYWIRLRFSGDPMAYRDYRPVAEVSFAADYAIWRLDPIGYHLTSVLLHAANAALVYCFAFRVLGDRRAAVLCALLFAVHPVHVEAVAWAKARSSLLALLFVLASLLLYLSALERPPGAAARARYVGSLCALALALGSKASAVSVPVLLGVYLWCFRDRYRLRGPLLGLLPFVGVVGAFLALKAVIPESPEHPLSGPIYRGLPTAIAALGAYLRLLVLPVGLCLDHSLEPARSFADPTVLRALPWGLVLLVGGVLALRRSGAPLLSLAWLLMGIAPVATLIVPGRLIAEARLYGPSVGFCMLAGALLLAVSSLPWLRSAPRVGHAASLVLCALLAATYAGLTVRRSADWSSRERILRDTVAKNPSSHRAHADLASVYILDQKLEAAIPHLRHAIALRPDDGRTLRNLARSCRHTGRYDEAITYYSRALLQQPRNVDLLMGLGIGYVETGQHDEAIEQFETVLRLDPVSAEAHCNVGLAHEMMGNKADAARCYRRCVELGGPAAKKASERLTALDAVQQPPP